MARLARVVIPGLPHHVTQRGNRRALVFFEDHERQRYLALVQQYCRRYGLQVLAYCLMDNHMHWVVVPDTEAALGQTIREAHTAYAASFNVAHRAQGHVFQGRFFSCALDDEHLWAAVRYVERNPVRAGLTAAAEDYPWSSAQGHCGLRQDFLLAAAFPPAGAVADWRAWLKTEDVPQSDFLRRQTQTGRPCGSPGSVRQLEVQLKRALLPRPRGPRRRVVVQGQGDLF